MEAVNNFKTTLVVGADSDIGSRLVQSLSGEIIAHYYVSKEKVDGINCESRHVIPVFGDLSSIESINTFVSEVKLLEKNISRIVHLPASPATPNRIARFDPNRYLREINIEVVSAALILKEFLPLMSKAGFGRIAFILTSYCIGVPPKYLTEYVSAKYALMGVMKSLAVEYAGKGITINAVAPSMIDTKFLSSLPDFEIESAAKNHPMGRNATPEDIVPVLKMLLDEDIEYMTGTVIPITGGSQFF